MSIDLSKLSAKELFELAQQKEKEEQEAAERQGKLDEFKDKREAMISEHKNILLLTDKKIRDMQEQREKLASDQEQALAELDKEIEGLGGGAAKKTAKPVAASSSGGNNEKLKSTIRQIMNKRPYISASLLKEKLEGYGIKPSNFQQDLEQWINDGWFQSKGKGNYALGKKI
jgi:chromosome segregation ATPase